MFRKKCRRVYRLGFELVLLALFLLTVPLSSTHADSYLRQGTHTYSSTPDLVLQPGSLEDTIFIPDAGSISDLDVYVDLGLAQPSSVTIQLSHATTGTTILLVRTGHLCNGNTYFDLTYDDEAPVPAGTCMATGTLRPNSALSAFDGEDMQGLWQIRFTGAGSMVGMLFEWRLVVTSGLSGNLPPAATDDTYTTAEDTPLTVAAPGVLGNDTDVDGDMLAAAVTTGPAHGTLTLNADGSFTYTPAANFHGSDSFTYTTSDGKGGADTGTVTILVTSVNDRPAAADDTFGTGEDMPLTVPAPGVLANDTDADGDPLAAAPGTSPAHGTLTLNADGSFTYTPAADFHGSDSFTYTASDGKGGADTATVTITVTHVNIRPTATDDTYTTAEDTPLMVSAPGVLANDTDVDGDTLTAAVTTGPAHGTLTLNADGSFTYTPAANFHGSDSFTYTASDGKGGADTATVTITVTSINDPPAAADDTYTTAEDTPLTVAAPGVLGNDTDVDGDTLAAAPGTGPAHGTLTLNADGSFTYTPAANFHGSDSFTYTASDGLGGMDTATVTITVTHVNIRPTANADTYSTVQNTPLTVPVPGVLGNDTDPDGDPLSAALYSALPGITLTLSPDGALSYTPEPGWRGILSFTYVVNDGNGGRATATVTITVTPANVPPVADDDAYSTVRDTPLTVAAPGVLANDNDPDAGTLTASVDTPPAYGTLALEPAGAFTYTPAAGWSGTDTFTYIANDGRGGTDTATVTIFVFEASSPPPPDPTSTLPPTPTPVPGPSGPDTGPDAGPQLPPPAAPTATPPPQTIPLCASPTGSTSAVVRADVPHDAVAGGVFCRVIAQHGAYISRQGGPGDIGHPAVLRYPILHAVDVYGMVGDTSVPHFAAPVKVCLQGVGTLFYLDATTAPRALSTPPVTLENGYTCATIPHAGTLVLASTVQ